MGNITIKNGSPTDGEPLCKSCEHVHMQKGFRESDEAIFCTYRCWDAPRPVLFRVRECTDYQDRTTPSRDWMEENALIVETRKSVHEAGFRLRIEQGDESSDEPVVVNE